MANRSNNQGGEDAWIIIVIGAGILLLGIVYSLLSYPAELIGDCNREVDPGILSAGVDLLASDTGAPMLWEGAKIWAEFFALIGAGILIATYWSNQKQKTVSRMRRGTKSRNWTPILYVIGAVFFVGGLGATYSIVSNAQAACVAGVL